MLLGIVVFALFAGPGLRSGQVIGTSDNIAAYPVSNLYYPSDLGATIFQSLGIDPRSIKTESIAPVTPTKASSSRRSSPVRPVERRPKHGEARNSWPALTGLAIISAVPEVTTPR